MTLSSMRILLRSLYISTIISGRDAGDITSLLIASRAPQLTRLLNNGRLFELKDAGRINQALWHSWGNQLGNLYRKN
jgi:hypothetical protein